MTVSQWKSGLPFTVCGAGSLPGNTATARRVLPEWCKKYGLHIVNDAGAGDMMWRKGMVWDVTYRPFDLSPVNETVTKIDITEEAMPACDLILCRWVLNHVGINHAKRAVALFPQSGRYLAATQYDIEMPKGRYDLRKWLGPPLESVPDGGDNGSALALWHLHD